MMSVYKSNFPTVFGYDKWEVRRFRELADLPTGVVYYKTLGGHYTAIVREAVRQSYHPDQGYSVIEFKSLPHQQYLYRVENRLASWLDWPEAYAMMEAFRIEIGEAEDAEAILTQQPSQAALDRLLSYDLCAWHEAHEAACDPNEPYEPITFPSREVVGSCKES